MSSNEEDQNDDKPLTVTFTTNPADSPWWAADISSVLRPEARKMLEEYAHIPPDEVIDHIAKTRERAYSLAPYASIGALTWLNPYITLHPSHLKILFLVKSGASILDCGCFIAPDLRSLACSGAPTENMYAFDIEPAFFPLSYDFYHDKATFHAKMFQADALEPFATSHELTSLLGKIDILWCPKFLHLFDRTGQIALASRLISLLRPKPGSLFVGSQNGYPGTLDIPLAPGTFKGQGSTFFLGDEGRLREMWREVGEGTGTKWEVEARLLDLRTVGLHVDDGTEYRRRTGWCLQWTATLLESARSGIGE